MDFFHWVALVFLATFSTSLYQINARVSYNPSDERSDASMGVGRVARFFTPAYESGQARRDDDIFAGLKN